jgi:hypothetical protein
MEVTNGRMCHIERRMLTKLGQLDFSSPSPLCSLALLGCEVDKPITFDWLPSGPVDAKPVTDCALRSMNGFQLAPESESHVRTIVISLWVVTDDRTMLGG